MFDFSEIQLGKLVIHKVGNKSREEGCILSPSNYELMDGNIEEMLLRYFLSSFKDKAMYKFAHETDIHLNDVYMLLSKIFIEPQAFYEQSVTILQQLYDKSTHPQIKAGEVYLVYFSGCLVDNQKTEAIGIFKTESKENYLKVYNIDNEFYIDADKGINIKKLDKGCIVVNTNSVDGYRILIVDTVTKNGEASYWKDDFLKLEHVQDDYFHTQDYLKMCQDFAENVYGPIHQAGKNDQVVLVNEAITYFDKNEEFQLEDFMQNVIKEPELIEQFKEYSQAHETNQGMTARDNFSISGHAVKAVKRKFKNLIKLDTNMEIKVNKVETEDEGNMQYIERGYDPGKNMHFYKLYFNAEE